MHIPESKINYRSALVLGFTLMIIGLVLASGIAVLDIIGDQKLHRQGQPMSPVSPFVHIAAYMQIPWILAAPYKRLLGSLAQFVSLLALPPYVSYMLVILAVGFCWFLDGFIIGWIIIGVSRFQRLTSRKPDET